MSKDKTRPATSTLDLLDLLKQANGVGRMLTALSWDELSDDEFDVAAPIAAKYLKVAQTAADYLMRLRERS